ncbi:MAG: hypothetical protein QOD77_1669 [Thermoplasmata archaeon]|jgi:hypothetical protein|nr:hypothetical protein [Thermoplasmata archaeon]
MADWTADLAVAAGILLGGIALLLAVLGVVAWRRLRAGRLLWVSAAFAGFAAEGAYLAWLAYQRRADVAEGAAGEFPILALANLGIVLCLYVAVLKR